MLSPLHLPLLPALFYLPSLNAIRAQGDKPPLTALCICRAFAGDGRASRSGSCLPPGCWGGRRGSAGDALKRDPPGMGAP